MHRLVVDLDLEAAVPQLIVEAHGRGSDGASTASAAHTGSGRAFRHRAWRSWGRRRATTQALPGQRNRRGASRRRRRSSSIEAGVRGDHGIPARPAGGRLEHDALARPRKDGRRVRQVDRQRADAPAVRSESMPGIRTRHSSGEGRDSRSSGQGRSRQEPQQPGQDSPEAPAGVGPRGGRLGVLRAGSTSEVRHELRHQRTLSALSYMIHYALRWGL